jgi:2-dehydro-3-deoxygluconokinase
MAEPMTTTGTPVDVVAVGETMVMLVPEDGRTLADARSLATHAGGAESNVAMYLSRMGVPVRWASVMSDDPLAHRIVSEIASAGVDVSAVCWRSDGHTGIYLKNPGADSTTVYYYRHRSAARFLDEAIWEDERLRDSRVLHLTGITPALSATARGAIEQAVLHRCAGTAAISFDVNYRAPLWYPSVEGPVLQELAAAAEVVLVGLEEASVLCGCESPEDVLTTVPGAGTLIVKDGAVGAHAFHQGERVFVPSCRVEVVEPVGAGDAFAAGYLRGLLDQRDVRACLRLGHLLAATALTVHSDAAQPPSTEWLEEQLAVSDEDWQRQPVRGPGQETPS